MPLGNWKGNGEMCGCQNEIGATKLGQQNCVNILLTVHHLNRIVTVSISQCSRTHIGMGLVNLTFTVHTTRLDFVSSLMAYAM